MRVVAIDPAPRKESTMYSEEDGFRQIKAVDRRIFTPIPHGSPT